MPSLRGRPLEITLKIPLRVLFRSRMSTQMARRVRQNIQSSGLAPGARRAGVGSGGSGHLEKRIQNVVSRINTDSKEQLVMFSHIKKLAF